MSDDLPISFSEELRRRAATSDEEFLPIEMLDTVKIVAEAIRRRAEAPDEDFVEHREGDFLKMLDEDIEERAKRST